MNNVDASQMPNDTTEAFFFDVEELAKQYDIESRNERWDEFIKELPAYLAKQEEDIKSAHSNAALIINPANVKRMKKIIEYLKSKGGTIDYNPRVEMHRLDVDLFVTYTDSISFEGSHDKEMLSELISKHEMQINTGYECDGALALTCTFSEIGKYLMGGEKNGKH